MGYIEKIKTQEELKASVDEDRCQGKSIVQCHGCFDILHPGHVRHLAWANRQGDVLAVTVSADKVIKKGASRPFVPQNLRAENLAALEMVDYVLIDDGDWAGPILEFVRPDIFVKGKEFENVYTGSFGKERRLVENYGGQVRFSSGDVVFSSTKIIERFGDELASGPAVLDVQFRARNRIEIEQLRKTIAKFASLEILVVGDLYLLETFACDAIGLSDEAFGLEWQSRILETEVGGAGSVALNLAKMGAQVELLGIVGGDVNADRIRIEVSSRRIENRSVAELKCNTLVRTQYSSQNQILLNVRNCRNLKPSQDSESRLIARIAEATRLDAIVIVDSGYGTVTDAIVEHLGNLAAKHGIPIIGEVAYRQPQADISRLKGITLTVCTERAARMSLNDPDGGVADLGAIILRNSQSLSTVISLEGGGFIVLDTKGRPASDLQSLSHSHELKMRLAIEFLSDPSSLHLSSDSGTPIFTGTTALGMAAGAGVLEAAYIGKYAAFADSHRSLGSSEELIKVIESAAQVVAPARFTEDS